MQSQKMESLGKLTGGIAHDFNNILGIISGYSSLLQASIDKESSEFSYLNEVAHATERGAKLTRKLLTMSKAKPVETTQIDINETIDSMRDVISKAATPFNKTQIQLSKEPGLIKVDVNTLEDALLNICINASHAMEERELDGVLSIQVDVGDFLSEEKTKNHELPKGYYHSIHITDNGKGIPQDSMSKIFDPFFSTKGDKGTGLGLSQVYTFVKQSGGFIEVESEVGQGTTFHLYFPDSAQQKSKAKSNETVETNLTKYKGTEKILIVDDEAQIATTTSELLSKYGYQCLSTTDPIKALELVNSEQFDLVLTDVLMPEMNGYELSGKLLSKQPNIKILFMSGFLSEDLSNQVMGSESSLLNKPFNAHELLSKVRETLQNPTL